VDSRTSELIVFRMAADAGARPGSCCNLDVSYLSGSYVRYFRMVAMVVSASACGVRGHPGSNITAECGQFNSCVYRDGYTAICSLGHGLRLTGANGQLSLASLRGR